MDKFGRKVQRTEFKLRCTVCIKNLEPGWLWIRGDYVQCPNCVNGIIEGLETTILPTRKILLPTRID